jgi:hypothetical protein
VDDDHITRVLLSARDVALNAHGVLNEAEKIITHLMAQRNAANVERNAANVELEKARAALAQLKAETAEPPAAKPKKAKASAGVNAHSAG